MEELLAKDRAGGDGLAQSSEVFAGWAAAEPEAAWEWLAASSDARLRSVFLPRFSSGVPEVPDELALEQFTNLPIEQKREKAVQAIQDLLETGGYDAAETLLDREASAAAGDPVAEGILQTLFDTVAKHREQAMKSGGSVEETTNWLASYSDRSFVRKEHYSIAAAELGAREGPESAAAWLASLASEDAAEPVKSALADNIQQWAVRDPAAAGAWVKTLEDHPSYEVMVSHLSEGLRNPGPKTINATP